MQALRTASSRFDDLQDYPFSANYLQIEDGESGTLRLHYLDEGPGTEDPVLCLHGEPSWSYLYRHMIPVMTQAGHRVIAPDLIGFGKSDKPTKRVDYTYQRHIDWTAQLLTQLDLRNITLVCQDWGGLIGLRLWAAEPQRFARIVVANSALPTGDHPLGEAFQNWRAFSQQVDPFSAGRIVNAGTVTKLTQAQISAYDAPFPDESFLAGARQFPMLVPDNSDTPDAQRNCDAWRVLRQLQAPVLTAFGAEDKIMAGADRLFQTLPGAQGQPHVILPAAGHFLQEDVGPELARLICAFIRRTSG